MTRTRIGSLVAAAALGGAATIVVTGVASAATWHVTFGAGHLSPSPVKINLSAVKVTVEFPVGTPAKETAVQSVSADLVSPTGAKTTIKYLALTSGNGHQGNWRGVAWLPPESAAGIWKINARAGAGSQSATKSPTGTFTVTKTRIPPLAVSPGSLTVVPGRTAATTVRVHLDEPTNVDYVHLELIRGGTHKSLSQMPLVGGDARYGVWSGHLGFGPGDLGVWRIDTTVYAGSQHSGPSGSITVKGASSLSADAGPEPVRKGHRLTVKGALRHLNAAGKLSGYAGQKVTIYLRPLGSHKSYRLGTAATDRNGNYSYKLYAARSGSFRTIWAGTGLYVAAASSEDYVRVRR
jgi:hypothetical protein